MKILVACEESQAVTIWFRRHAHLAYSCDLLKCSGGHPEWHIIGDALEVFERCNWDAIIAFPPCTDLAVSGARHFEQKRKDGSQQRSIDFFMRFVTFHQRTGIRLAIENPIGIMSSVYRKPDQIIHPWQFGHKASKATCLWLHGFPILKPTEIVGPPRKYKDMTAEELNEWTAIHRCPPGPDRARIRSKTYPGIARAMAEQWG